MTPRRPPRPPRPRTVLRVVGLLLLFVAVAAGITLAVSPAAAGVPLDPGIPNAPTLIARGLSGVPTPGQPTAPFTVDRVVTDGAATYVQFHSTAPPGRVPEVLLDLSDDKGAPVNFWGGLSTGYGARGWTQVLPAWFPWRPPPGPLHGVVTLGPLPPTARAALLRFSGTRSGTRSANGVSGTETVRVPLNLSALRQQRPYSGPLVQRASFWFRVVAARDTSLVLGFAPLGDLFTATLTDAQGHEVALKTIGGACGRDAFAATQLPCRQAWAYPPQRRGARLTLTLRSSGVGPWRLLVVIP